MPTRQTRVNNSFNSKLDLLEELSNFVINEIDADKNEIEWFLSLLTEKFQRKNYRSSRDFIDYAQEFSNSLDSANSYFTSEEISEKEVFSRNYSEVSVFRKNSLGFGTIDRSSSDANNISTNRGSNTKKFDSSRLERIIPTKNKLNIDEFDEDHRTCAMTETEADRMESSEQSLTPKLILRSDSVPTISYDNNLEPLSRCEPLVGNVKHNFTMEESSATNITENDDKMKDTQQNMRHRLPQRRRWIPYNKMTELHSSSIHNHKIRVYPKRPSIPNIYNPMNDTDSPAYSNSDDHSGELILLFDKVTDSIVKKYKRRSRGNLKDLQSFLENKSISKKYLSLLETSTTLTSKMPSWAIRGLINETKGKPIDLFGTILDRMSDYLIQTRGKIMKEDIDAFMRILSQKLADQETCWHRYISSTGIHRKRSMDLKNIIQNEESSPKTVMSDNADVNA